MEQAGIISKYTTYTDSIKRLEQNQGFRALEDSLVKTLDYLSSRYDVIFAYDFFSNPNYKRNDMQFKIRNDREEFMWVYFVYSDIGKYLSIEVDADRISSVRSELVGFDSIRDRHRKDWPTLKLIYRSYDQIEQSLKIICDCIDTSPATKTNTKDDINVPRKPKGIIHKKDGKSQYICGRCGESFLKAPRCPECGQLVKE